VDLQEVAPIWTDGRGEGCADDGECASIDAIRNFVHGGNEEHARGVLRKVERTGSRTHEYVTTYGNYTTQRGVRKFQEACPIPSVTELLIDVLDAGPGP
jgi:hypothetical protein